jgi:outer membrane protein OmpA-like peptidoglycan-associated protein
MKCQKVPPALALALLAGCATTTTERIVLLPSAGNHASALVVRTDKGETELSTPYEAAEVRNGTMVAKAVTPVEVGKRYGPLIEAQPPRPHRYLMYFLPGGKGLTPESKAQLETIRKEFSTLAAGEVVVIGHTDRVGAKQANDRLSLVRARMVREMLIHSGVPARSITVAGRGERAPLVPTADCVPEPKNRRVEIKLR